MGAGPTGRPSTTTVAPRGSDVTIKVASPANPAARGSVRTGVGAVCCAAGAGDAGACEGSGAGAACVTATGATGRLGSAVSSSTGAVLAGVAVATTDSAGRV